MRTITAAEFKRRCLTILDGLGPDGVVLTKSGRAVARVIPVRQSSTKLIGALRGRLTIKGNLLSTVR